ncbi:hypothetical protein BGX26_007466 [Mortierella sp. AD094]|nr:hypothetical protein BGX26_007466 [Mortierella sp. AD094]
MNQLLKSATKTPTGGTGVSLKATFDILESGDEQEEARGSKKLPSERVSEGVNLTSLLVASDISTDPLDTEFIINSNDPRLSGSSEQGAEILENVARLNCSGTLSSELTIDEMWVVNNINLSRALMNHRASNLIPFEGNLKFIPKVLYGTLNTLDTGSYFLPSLWALDI